MGTNIYMRRIPTAEQKEELKRLLKQQYEDTVASIDRDGWLLLDEYGKKIDPDRFWDDYVTCMEDGWTGETYDEWERKRGHYPPFPCAGYEHVTPAGLRFARDSDFC